MGAGRHVHGFRQELYWAYRYTLLLGFDGGWSVGMNVFDHVLA